jgi:hypothetical protein
LRTNSQNDKELILNLMKLREVELMEMNKKIIRHTQNDMKTFQVLKTWKVSLERAEQN